MQISLWEKESFYKPSDVLIIGSGFVGLWTALELKKKQPKLKITIVDRGIIPTGASTRNAGFSCFGSFTELLYDSKTFGEEKMLTLAKLRYEGLLRIRETFKPKEIGYQELGGYEVLTGKESYDLSSIKSDLKKLNKSLSKVFKEDEMFRLADHKIKKFGFDGVQHLIENKLEGQLQPGKLTQALLQEVLKLGVRVLFGYEATSFEKINDGVAVNSEHVSLHAKKLVICTNAFTNNLLPQLNVQPARGQVMVTSPIPGLKFKGCFHSDEGFIYFRNFGKRVLLGGARNKFIEQEYTTELTTSDNVQQELERLLRDVIIPGEKDYSIEYRWSGIMGMGTDKMPTVKELEPGIFCAVAMGGIGVAMAPVVAKQVSRMLLQKRTAGI
ncbi:MAG: FAD-binding oxidoreductase [Chitinophagaceae bacterium]